MVKRLGRTQRAQQKGEREVTNSGVPILSAVGSSGIAFHGEYRKFACVADGSRKRRSTKSRYGRCWRKLIDRDDRDRL